MYYFPFGQPLRRLSQQDTTPKSVFVLGVYASAVHARWVKEGRTICQALAVASEPYIFWDGNTDEARTIISSIKIPSALGELIVPNMNLNGPSARILVDNILAPLGISRNQAWLCDLLPESRLNPNQKKIIMERYNPLIAEYGLNEVTIPIRGGSYYDKKRIDEITAEIVESKAETLILLGDYPIKQYLMHVCDADFADLRDYTNKHGYGTPYLTRIGGYLINVLPLAHPRQIGGLGPSCIKWHYEHQLWESQR